MDECTADEKTTFYQEKTTKKMSITDQEQTRHPLTHSTAQSIQSNQKQLAEQMIKSLGESHVLQKLH